MAYVLLWIENLASSLLFMAAIIACMGRIRHRWLGATLSAAVGMLVFIPHLLLCMWLGFTKFHDFHDFGFYPILALTIFYSCGTIWLWIAGIFSNNGGSNASRAAGWPIKKLALAFGIALALHMMTFWNIDLEARQQALFFRTEAAAIAMSVVPPRVPDEDNAALLYEQAVQSLMAVFDSEAAKQEKLGDNVGKWLDAMDKPGFDARDPQLVDYLKRQSGTLSIIMQAVKKPGFNVERDFNNMGIDIAMSLPEVQYAREVARLLALDARCKAAAGDLAGAMQDVNALLIIAKQNGSEPLLVAMLVSCSIEGYAFDALQYVIVSHIPSAADLENVNIDGIFSYQRLLQRAIRYEEAWGWGWLSDSVNKSVVNYYVMLDNKPGGFDLRPVPGVIFRTFMLDGQVKAQLWHSEKLRWILAKPYYESKYALHKLCDNARDAPKSLYWDIFILSSLDASMTAAARADAHRRIAELVLAMCRYHAKNGKYPEKLEDLIPDFIAFVPLDPFDGKSIRLKKADGKLVIYSIGSDEIDDGGARFDPQTQKGDIIFELPNK